MSRSRAGRLMRSPWPPVLVGVAAIVWAVAVAPFAAAIVVLALSAACWLVWKFGARVGLWLLFLASIPFREPLSIDIVGTASFFPTDVLLVGLFADAAYRGELRRVWRSSVAFKIGLAILVLSLPGLMTATRLFWGVTSVYRIALQVALLVVASSLVRSGRDATLALVAVVVGLAPSVAYGLYHASLPFGAELPDWANQFLAYGPTGEPSVRVFSTFDHPLSFSLYLTVGFGLSLGLALSALRRAAKVALLVMGAATAYCNMFTASIGGTVGMLSVFVVTLILGRRRVAVFVPFLIVLLLLLSPPNLVDKADRVLSGKAATVAARMVTYRQGVAALQTHPFLGVGWGGIRRFMEHDYRLTRAYNVPFGTENYFLQRGVALGVPGLALYLALCVLFFRNLSRTRGSPAAASWPGAAIFIGGVAFYVQAQSVPSTWATNNLILWLLFALAARMAEDVGRPAPPDADEAARTGPMLEGPNGSVEPGMPGSGPEPEPNS
ncbi:O-antigen ligase family protein [bacterium]|nr:O-antigen ligase family protein [bacterium]